MPATTGLPMVLDRNGLSARQIGLVMIVLLLLVLDGLDVQILALVSPVIIAEWQTSKAAFGPALAAALVGMAFGSISGGWLGDRFGRRPVLLASAALFGLVTLAAAYAATTTQLALLRLACGMGFGAALPNGFALASEWMPARHKTRMLSVLSIGVPLGGVIGAPLTLLVLPEYGWQGCFLVCGAVTLLLLFVMLPYLAESPVHLVAKGDHDRAASLLSKVLQTHVKPTDLADAQLIDVGNGERVRLLSRVNTRMNIGIWLASFCASAITYAVAAWAPIMLTANGFTLSDAIRASFLHNCAGIVAALSASFAIDRFGSRRMICVMLGCAFAILLTIGGILMANAPNATPEARTAITVLMILLGASAGFATTTIYSILSMGYPAQIRGAGIGAGLTWGRLGAIMMVATGGVLLEMRADGGLLLGVLAGSAILALCGALTLDRHIPARR